MQIVGRATQQTIWCGNGEGGRWVIENAGRVLEFESHAK